MGTYACTADAIAAMVLATVVSLDGDRVTVDAGSKTLTMSRDGAFGFGHLRDRPASRFTRLSEEHGVLNLPDAETHLAVGDRVESCPSMSASGWICSRGLRREERPGGRTHSGRSDAAQPLRAARRAAAIRC